QHHLRGVEAMLHGAAVVHQIELTAQLHRHGKIQIEHVRRLLVRIVVDALHSAETEPPEQLVLVDVAAIVGLDPLHAEGDRATPRTGPAERRGDQLARAARDAHRSMLAVPKTVRTTATLRVRLPSTACSFRSAQTAHSVGCYRGFDVAASPATPGTPQYWRLRGANLQTQARALRLAVTFRPTLSVSIDVVGVPKARGRHPIRAKGHTLFGNVFPLLECLPAAFRFCSSMFLGSAIRCSPLPPCVRSRTPILAAGWSYSATRSGSASCAGCRS